MELPSACASQAPAADDPAASAPSQPTSLPAPHRAFSCDRCTRRKQRCDKLLPSCTQCRAVGIACSSSEREANVVHGKDKEVTRKGVVTSLLERIAALEKEQERRRGQGEPESEPGPGRWQSADDVRSPDEEAGPSRVTSDARMDVSTDIASASTAVNLSDVASASASASGGPAEESGMSMNFLSLSAMAEPRNRAGEFLKHLSTPRLIAGVTETFGGNPESTARVSSLWEGISQYIRHPAGASQRLHIPRDEALKALDSYLEIVDFRFPRLPVAKVQAGINAISATGGGDEAYSSALSRNPSHIFMAYLVVAIVPLVSDSYPISQGSWVSVHLLSKCLKLLDRVFHLEDGVDIIQCLHLLIVLSIHCSTAGSAWHLVGFAMNKCIALGYHREDSRAVASLSAFDLQQRRWAFWGCYLLDRLICAGLGRPFSIDDRDISVPLPEPGSPAGNASSLGGGVGVPPASLTLREASHVHLFRYAILLSSAVQDCPAATDAVGNSDFETLLGHALYWRTTAPTWGNPSVADIHSHQTSLYNTLLLRIAIREIDRGFTFDSPSWDGQQTETPLIQYRLMPGPGGTGADEELVMCQPGSFLAAQIVLACERDRIRRIHLLQTCRAVARSLDRTRMVGRPYLSFLTGYSAFSMGLACLYYLAVTSHLAGQSPDNPMFTTPSSVDTHGRGHAQWRSQLDYRGPQTILDLASQKLEIVGRQFPRLQEYRVILERLRYLVSVWPTRFQLATTDGFLVENEVAELRKAVCGISPTHLKLLAAAVIHILTLS